MRIDHEEIERMLDELEESGCQSDHLISLRQHFNERLYLNPGQIQRLDALYRKYILNAVRLGRGD